MWKGRGDSSPKYSGDYWRDSFTAKISTENLMNPLKASLDTTVYWQKWDVSYSNMFTVYAPK